MNLNHAAPLQVELIDSSPWTGPVIAAFTMSLLSLLFSIAWSVYTFRRSGPHLKVQVQVQESWTGGLTFTNLTVMVRNVGRQSTAVTGIRLTMDKNRSVGPRFETDSLPQELKPAHAIVGKAYVPTVLHYLSRVDASVRSMEVTVSTGLGDKTYPLRRVSKSALRELEKRAESQSTE